MAIDDPLTERIIGCALTVHKTLGCGFLEKIYENAMVIECRKTGLDVITQHGIKVTYDGVVVGDFVADMLINQEIIVELKAIQALDDIHLAQCINYVKATGMKRCLLLNFGKGSMEIKRVVG